MSPRNDNLMNLLGNTKEKIKEIEKLGIYQIQCENCERYYIGQTRENIRGRY